MTSTISTSLPANVSYGTVVGRFGSGLVRPGDSDGIPDFVAATDLTVIFKPAVPVVIDASAVPPMTLNLAPITCTIDSDGYLVGPSGTRGVTLIATDDEDLNPTGWTWMVMFVKTGYRPSAITPFSMSMQTGATIDLALVIPASSTVGTAVGPAQVAANLALTRQLAAQTYAITALDYANAANASAVNASQSVIAAQSAVADAIAAKIAAQNAVAIPGPPGPKGDLGNPGPTGPTGPTGLTGPIGATGPAGVNGTNGINGTNGVNGVDGATGPAGPTGDPGVTGPVGPAGFDYQMVTVGPAGSGATFTVDGTADNVEIQAAIDSLTPGGVNTTSTVAGAQGVGTVTVGAYLKNGQYILNTTPSRTVTVIGCSLTAPYRVNLSIGLQTAVTVGTTWTYVPVPGGGIVRIFSGTYDIRSTLVVPKDAKIRIEGQYTAKSGIGGTTLQVNTGVNTVTTVDAASGDTTFTSAVKLTPGQLKLGSGGTAQLVTVTACTATAPFVCTVSVPLTAPVPIGTTAVTRSIPAIIYEAGNASAVNSNADHSHGSEYNRLILDGGAYDNGLGAKLTADVSAGVTSITVTAALVPGPYVLGPTATTPQNVVVISCTAVAPYTCTLAAPLALGVTVAPAVNTVAVDDIDSVPYPSKTDAGLVLLNTDHTIVANTKFVGVPIGIDGQYNGDVNKSDYAGGLRVQGCSFFASDKGIKLQNHTQNWITDSWFLGNPTSCHIHFISSNKQHLSNNEFNSVQGSTFIFDDTTTLKYNTGDINITGGFINAGTGKPFWVDNRSNSASKGIIVSGVRLVAGVTTKLFQQAKTFQGVTYTSANAVAGVVTPDFNDQVILVSGATGPVALQLPLAKETTTNKDVGLSNIWVKALSIASPVTILPAGTDTIEQAGVNATVFTFSEANESVLLTPDPAGRWRALEDYRPSAGLVAPDSVVEITSANSPYTVATGTDVVLVNAFTAPVQVILPVKSVKATAARKSVVVKVINSTNTVTISGAGTGASDDIDTSGVTSIAVNDLRAVTFQALSSSSRWRSWTSVDGHAANLSNPHATTKSQVGLANADNTSDVNKPVSTATTSAISTAIAPATSHIANVSNPHATTKSQVGLGNVDNTADTAKPVSTAQQAAIDAATGAADAVVEISATTYTLGATTDVLLVNAFSNAVTVTLPARATKAAATRKSVVIKVINATNQVTLQAAGTDEIDSSGVTSLAFTELRAVTLQANSARWRSSVSAEGHIANVSNPHATTKSQVGLANVDNTSDVNKPVSTATTSAISTAVAPATTHIASTSNPHSVTKTQVGLGSVDNTADTAKPVSTAQAAAIALARPDVQFFTSSGTWTKPAGVTWVTVIAQAPGNGGGSGRRGAASTIRCGGGGGSGGTRHVSQIPASLLASTVSVTIGAGGTGGAAVAADDTDGNAGGIGGTAAFGSYAYAGNSNSLNAGRGGTATSGAGGTSSAGQIVAPAGGAASATGGVGATGGNGTNSPGSGGAGGGIPTTNTFSAGTAGGYAGWSYGIAGGVVPYLGGAAGATAGANGTASADNVANSANPSPGGGGGASSVSGAAGAGGAGGSYGGGGGGGGASLNGSASGAGGAGGPGMMIVISQ